MITECNDKRAGAGADLKSLYDFLHLVSVEVEITLNEITVDEAGHRLRLLIRVKRPPAGIIRQQKLPRSYLRQI